MVLSKDVLDCRNKGDYGGVGRVRPYIFLFNVLVEPEDKFLLKSEVSFDLSSDEHTLD